MALVAILVLVVFSMVLVNVIYMCVLKVKAQNAADNLALSAATLKARVLNQITDLNAGLYFIVRKFGRIPAAPYNNEAEFNTMAALEKAIASPDDSSGSIILNLVAKYNRNIQQDKFLNRIAHENGVNASTHRAVIFPLDLALTDFATDIIYVSYKRPPGIVSGIPFAGSIEPVHTPWWVQARVEWPTRGEMIGMKNLNIRLPDIAVRARALIYDTVPGALPYQHCWKVRLVQPDAALDEQMRQHDYIW
jgi:hypothetical protein